MTRLSFALVLLTGMIAAASALWLSLGHPRPGPLVSAADLLPPNVPLTRDLLVQLHEGASLICAALIGAFSGFVAHNRATRTRAPGSSSPGRLAAWHGLALATAITAYIALSHTGLPPSVAFPDLVPPALPSLPTAPDALLRAAALWAALLGLGALLGAEPGQLWAGRLVQIGALISLASVLAVEVTSSVGNASSSFHASFLFAGLALLAATSLQLRHADSPAAPHLWIAALLMTGAIFAEVWHISINPASIGAAQIGYAYMILFALPVFGLISAWRQWTDAPPGLWPWVHATGLALLFIAMGAQLIRLSMAEIDLNPSADFGVFASGRRDASLWAIALVFWAALGFIRGRDRVSGHTGRLTTP